MTRRQLLYILFSTISLAFVTQPIGVRVAELPVPAILMLATCVCFVLLGGPMHRQPILAIAGPVPILLALAPFSGGDVRGAIFAFYLIFCALAYGVRLSDAQIQRVWALLGWACLLLTALGVYRYLTGYVAPSSENEAGLLNAKWSYFYLGLSYLPATRNSDGFYFGIPCLIFLWLGSEKRGVFRYTYYSLALVEALCVVLTLSRGIWIALFLAIAFSYPRKYVILAVVCGALVAIGCSSIVSSGGLEWVLFLVKNGLLSVFDPDGASSNTSGFYTYSNADRSVIYTSAISDFMSWPFGYGVNYIPSYAALTGVKTVHSENLYLDFLVILGVFSFPLFFAFVRALKSTFRARVNSKQQFLRSIGVFLGLYAAFNSGIDFAIFWYAMAMFFLSGRKGKAVYRFVSGAASAPVGRGLKTNR